MIFENKITFNIFLEAIPRDSANLGVVRIGTTRHLLSQKDFLVCSTIGLGQDFMIFEM